MWLTRANPLPCQAQMESSSFAVVWRTQCGLAIPSTMDLRMRVCVDWRPRDQAKVMRAGGAFLSLPSE